MQYEGTIIRPPSEANSILLQVAVGCPHNGCTFCGAYRGERYRVKDDSVIAEDLRFARQHCKRLKRVFLIDGDVLALSQEKLIGIFRAIRENLPWVNRVGLYGSARSILRKSPEELGALKELGLNRVYMGLESGHSPTLIAIEKGSTAEEMIAAGQKIRQVGFFLSVTVLLGLAGNVHSLAHAEATGRVLSGMKPSQIAVLTLMLLENTPLYQRSLAGDFQMPDQQGLLNELHAMVSHIDVDRAQFQANHASNYLPISCRLPKDKDALLASIEKAIAGELVLKPEFLRAL